MPRRVRLDAVRRREIDDAHRRRPTSSAPSPAARAAAASAAPAASAVDAPQLHGAARAVLDALGEQDLRPRAAGKRQQVARFDGEAARRQLAAPPAPAPSRCRAAAVRQLLGRRQNPAPPSGRSSRSAGSAPARRRDEAARQPIILGRVDQLEHQLGGKLGLLRAAPRHQRLVRAARPALPARGSCRPAACGPRKSTRSPASAASMRNACSTGSSVARADSTSLTT